MDARFRTPFSLQISGPSQSGKSSWVCQLLRYNEDLLETPASKIRWYTPHAHFPHKNLPPQFTLITGKLPWDDEELEEETEDEEEEKSHQIIVIDDYGDETRNSKELTSFITKHSHHRNISIIEITQNLFWPGPHGRTRSLNIHYFVLMKQNRDMRQVRTLAQQIAFTPSRVNGFLMAYAQATDGTNLYGYLLISIHPRDPPELLLRTNIFPEESKSTQVFLLQNSINRSSFSKR